MAPKVVDKAKKRQELLGAAFQVFGQKGYHTATLADIARAAGIGQGTLYYYFRTKEEIFWGVYELIMTYLEKDLRSRLEKHAQPQERLKEILWVLLRDYPEFQREEEQGSKEPYAGSDETAQWREAAIGLSQVFMEFWLQAERSGKQKDFYQRLARYQRSIAQILKEIFCEIGVEEFWGLDLEHTIRYLMALRDGLSFHVRIGAIQKNSPLLESLYGAFLKQFLGQGSPSEAPGTPLSSVSSLLAPLEKPPTQASLPTPGSPGEKPTSPLPVQAQAQAKEGSPALERKPSSSKSKPSKATALPKPSKATALPKPSKASTPPQQPESSESPKLA